MPKASVQFAIARQWEMLKRLPSRGPGITAAQLTTYLEEEKGFAVSKRTVERDLIELALQFGIHCNEQSVPYGWHWLPGRQCDFTSLDLADAVSLVLTESVLTKLLPAAMLAALRAKFDLARSKLATLENHRYARWAEKVRYVSTTLNTIPPKVELGVFATIQEALMQESQVTVGYTAPRSKKATEITLHPLSLIQRGATPYLVATAFEYPDVRLYAIHRMSRAVLVENKSRRPKGYSTDGYLASGAMEFGGGGSITLKAWVNNELAIYLAETPLSLTQTIRFKEGRYLLTADVKNSWQLHWWILSQGEAIIVISPERIRSKIADSLNAASRNYSQS
jgi:predicted DNA-binding transcriptional regulator YafY